MSAPAIYTAQRNADALVSRSAAAMGNSDKALRVQALYPYSYEVQPGRKISFEAGDYFILVEKSNEDWWHVRKGEQDIYVPANYMREFRIEFSDIETTDGNDNTLSPSSDDSCQDDISAAGEETTTFGGCDSERIYANVPNTSERIYANIPVIANGREPIGMRRHSSTGDQHNHSNKVKEMETHRRKSATLPSGWSNEEDKSARKRYVNKETYESSRGLPSTRSAGSNTPADEWQSTQDEEGRTYYYNKNNETVWEIPTHDDQNKLSPLEDAQQNTLNITTRIRMQSEGSESAVNLRQRSLHLHLRSSRSTSTLFTSDSIEACTAEMSSFAKGQRSPSEQGRNSLVLSDEFPPPLNLSVLDYSVKKEGTINRKKLCEKGGKKVKKAWSSCYVKLSSANMIMYKNHTAAQQRPGFADGQPESSCELRGAVIEKMPDENKRRNIMQIATVAKLCFLLQVDDVHDFNVWYTMISDVVKYLEENVPVDNGVQARLYGETVNLPRRASQPALSIVSTGSLKKQRADGDKKNIRDRLRKLITKRPTFEELQKKGIIKDITFGCHILKLCERENTKVPRVVVGCIEAIENKGLHFDGLYRISGNVSSIQQLRISVDQEENVQFGERPYDDVHVLSGTLKLYFRELPEPLIPFDSYDRFIDAIKTSPKQAKTVALRTEVNQLPSPNCETFRYLFRHLKRVMKNSSENRMHAHNIAIVFGPTLLAPREEHHASIALNTVYQNQIVEFILLEYDQVLGKDN